MRTKRREHVSLAVIALSAAALSGCSRGTQTFEQDRARLSHSRNQFHQLTKEVQACGAYPVRIDENDSSQPCPDGGVDRVKRIQSLLGEASVMDVNLQAETAKEYPPTTPPYLISFRTGASGLGINEGSSASSITYFLKPTRSPGAEYRALEESSSQWFYTKSED